MESLLRFITCFVLYFVFSKKHQLFAHTDLGKSVYRCTLHFEIYVVHSPTNALFINLVKSFKLTLKYIIISLLHVSVFNDHHQGALSVRN